MGWIVYSKDGQTEKCVLHKLEYSGTFMGDRTVIATFSSEKKIDFSVFDYITYRGERFELELLPTVKKVSSYEYKYELRFVSLKYELERCMMRNIVPGDNGIVYPTPLSVEFTGDVKYLAERIQACLDAMYGKGAWSITIAESTESEEKNISMSNQNCWDALSLVNTEYKLNYFIKGRNVIIGGEEPVVDNVFEYGKGKGLYEIERISDTDTGVVTKLRAYGGTRNLDYSYPKLPDWKDSVLPANYALSPLRLMLPSFKADGKTDYVLASEEAIAKYGIREGTITYDDIYPSITGMKNSSGQAIDEIKSVSAITNETQPTFTVGLYDLGFDLNESLTTDEAQMSMKSGSLQGYTFNITKIERASDGSYTLTLGRNTLEKEDTGNFTVPNKDWNMKAGDKFVLLNILMPQAYIRDAENRLLARAKEYLAKYSSTNYSYNVGVDEIFMARNVNFYNDIMEGKRLTVNDQEIGINNENIIIQSLTIKEGEGIIPTFEVTLNNETTASTLDRIQGQISEVETSVSNNFSSQSELLKQYRKKLDKSVWDSIFVIHKDDSENPEKITSVQSLVGLWTNEFLSAKGLNPGSGGGSGEGGATALYQLNDVAKNASETGVLGAGPGKVLTYGNDGKWYAADAVGLDETALGKYLTDNNYAKKSDIPSLSGYATQSWVLGKNYITSDALSGYATQSWVNSQGYATASSLKDVSDKLNDFLEGSDTDGIINKWKELEAFLAGQTQTSTLADLLAVKADKATTLSGYGITDAYTKTEVNTKLGSYVTTTALNTALAKKVDVAFLAKVFGFIGEDSSEVSINDMGSVITSIKAKFGLWTDEYLSSKGLNPNAGGGSGEGATALYQLNDVSQNASGTGVLGAETGKVLTYGSDGKWYAAKAGMDEDALSSYLTENNYAQKSDIPSLNGYATQSWVNTALEKKVDKVSGMGLSHNDFTDTLLQKLNGIAEGANKYILPIAKAAVLGGVMIGSTLTASATGVLDLPEVAVAGTYAKVTTDVYGRVTAGSSLSTSDIPALGISKITGLQAALDNKVNKADFVTEFDKAMQRWFVRDTANKGLHPADYDSEAVGIYSDSYMSAKGVNTGAGGSAGGASSLGELNNVGSWADDIPTVDRIMVQRKGATHWESLNLSDIGLNETQLSDYLTTNNYAKKSDIPSLSGYATQAWVNTKLADYATTSSVTTLLAEKVDKVEGKGLSANDFTDTLLNKLNGIEAGANKYVLPTASGSVLGGVKVGTTLSIANGVLNLKSGIATAGTYTKVTVDTYGRVVSGDSLVSGDIPTLAISKISGLQTALDDKANKDGSNATGTWGISITGSSRRLYQAPLTNEDLNDYTYANHSGKMYYAGGDNTTVNSPSDAYGLMVWRIAAGYTGHLMFDSAGDFRARFNNGTTWSAWDKLAYITDNVASATKLQTARTINGTSFNGTANITTANWGTARNLTIGGAVKSVNGSANVSFSLNEINAAYGRNVTYTGTTTAQGWYRLASTGVGINPTNSLFFISVTVSGQHSTFLLQVSTNYGNNPSLIQLGGSNYSTASIDQFRLVYHTTYSGHYGYLEVRSRAAMTDATFNVFLVGRANTTWTLSTALTAGSIPEGYTSKTLTPASASIVAPTFRGALVGNVTGNVTGNLTGNASTATSLQTARTLWGQSFNGTANITGTLLGVESLVARSGRINNFSGYFDNSGNPATGTICITLPNGWTSSMNIYEIWIYEYNTTANASVITIGAYNYNGGGTASSAKWVNIGYHTKGAYSKGVRLAYNGSKCVILLGTTATTWYYPKVYLKTIYTGHSNQTIWGGTSTISLITSETGYTNIDTPARMDEFFGDTSVTGRLAVTGAGHFGYTYTTMTAGINVKGDSATTGISIYDGTGTTARLYRKGDILYITRGGNDNAGLLMNTAGSIYPGTNNALANGTSSNRWSNVYTQLLNVAGLATTSRILASGEIQSTSAKAFRAIYGSYGFFIYNDGNSSYFMLTAKDDQYGTYNSLRPLYINNSTGVVTMGNGTNIGGILNVTNTTDATTTTAAAIKTAGGLAVAKQLRVGGAATLSSSLYVTGSATFMGGIRIGDYWLRSTADGLELSHATSGKTAGLYATGFLSSMGLNPGTGEGGSGSDYDRLDAWDDYSADKAGYVLSAKLGNDLNTRVKSLEGGSALTVTTTGSGNAVTSVAKSGTAITVTKGTTFVDLASAQTITGQKTWTVSQRMANTSIHRVNNASGGNATGSHWYTANYAAIQFGIGLYTDSNASPRAYIGWTSTPWVVSTNLTVSETSLTYKGNAILHSANYNTYAPTKTGGGASGSWGISITGNAATATTATKLGTATIGAANKPIYLNAGTPTALSSTVGDSVVPAYLNAGTVTACSWGLIGTTGKRVRKSGYITSGTSGLSSYWGKMASFDWGETSGERDITLYVHSGYNVIYGIVLIRVRWSSATSTIVTLKILNGNIPESRLRLYYDVSAKTNVLTLWGDVAGQWGVFNTYLLSETTRTSVETSGVTLYSTSFSTAQTLPTSTYIQATYLGTRGHVALSDVADKLGTSTVGSGVKPIYLNAGTATASTSTVGAANKGVYMSSGTITAMSSTVGSTTVPVYMNAGAITVCSTTLGVSITGNAKTATTLQTTRKIFSQPFSGAGDVAGQAMVYGTYQETASSRYSHGGIQVRENGLVADKQTADGYAPAIGFHWASRSAASLIYTTSGFKFMNQAFTGYANVYATLKGNADSATQVYNTQSNPTSGTWYAGTFITDSTTGNKYIRSNNGFAYYSLEGTASAQGEALIQIGNTTATGTAGNKRGRLRLCSSSSGYTDFVLTATTGTRTLTLPDATGTVALTSSNVASATKLQTARTLWGQSFNGTANVSGSLTGVGNITASAGINIISTGENNIGFLRGGSDATAVVLNATAFKPYDAATNKLNLGTSAARWLGLYANTGNFSSTVTGTRFISTVATGTAPLTVSSTTMVTNLNAQMVGGIGVSNIPLEYDASYIPTGTAARWLRIAYFDYSSANYSWSGTFAITNGYTNNENKGLIFTVSTAHGTTSPVITQIGGASGVFTSIRIVKDTTTVYPTTAKVYLEVYYNSTSAGNRVYVSYKPADRSIGKWTLYTTYTGGAIPTGHTAIAQLYTTSGLSTTANLRVQGTAVILGATNHNDRLDIQSDGKIVPHSTATRRSGVYGVYDSAKIGHIWSMGSAYQIADDGSTFGSLYGFAYKHTNNTTGGTMASGHQAVWCENGVPKVAIGSNLWVANNATISAALYTDTLTIKNTEAVGHIKFSRGSFNYITAPTSGTIAFIVNGQAVGEATADLIIQNGVLKAGAANATALGQDTRRWSNMYSVLLNVSGVATLSSTVNIAGVLNANNATDATSTTAAGAVFDGGVGIVKQLRVGGNVTIGGNVTFATSGLLSVPYSGGQWISLATRTNLIAGNQNTSEASAHALYRVKSFAGDAVVFGGLKNSIGFYGFYKTRIDSGDNNYDWRTVWDSTTGKLLHSKAFEVSGAVTFSSTLTVASTATFRSTTDATSTTAAAVKVTGGLGVAKQLRVGGAVTLSSTLAVTSTSTFTGKTTHNGGIGATTGTFSSTLSAAGVVSFTNATDATSTTAAAVKITGGLGIAKQLRVGGASTFSGTINTSVATFINLGANATDQKILKDVDGNGFYSGISFFGTKGSNMGVSDIMMNIYAGGAIQIHSQAGSGTILLNGTVHNNVGMYSDGYMSSKGLNDTSDMRLKNKGRDIFLSVKDMAHAPAFEYTWKDGTPGEMVGSSAQYWQKVLPPSVKIKKDGYMTMFYGHTALVATISLARHVETLEERVERLERENKEKDKRIKELERRISA